MNLILLGPPGAGKDTISLLLQKRYGIKQLSPGRLFRKAVAEKTELGIKAGSYVAVGKLVPDDITIKLIENCISLPKFKKGFILDGFPRTVAQAEALTVLFEKKKVKLYAVLHLDVPPEKLRERLTGRRSCIKCNAIYNIFTLPPRNGNICDNCGEKLVMRDDDKESVILRRLLVYEMEATPIRDYYKRRTILYEIDAGRNIEEISTELFHILDSKVV